MRAAVLALLRRVHTNHLLGVFSALSASIRYVCTPHL